MRNRNSRMQAPTKAMMPRTKRFVAAIPKRPASQPPTNAPRIPTTMSQMTPRPWPVMTLPARNPAIPPTITKTIRFIILRTTLQTRLAAVDFQNYVNRKTGRATVPLTPQAQWTGHRRPPLLHHTTVAALNLVLRPKLTVDKPPCQDYGL